MHWLGGSPTNYMWSKNILIKNILKNNNYYKIKETARRYISFSFNCLHKGGGRGIMLGTNEKTENKNAVDAVVVGTVKVWDSGKQKYGH